MSASAFRVSVEWDLAVASLWAARASLWAGSQRMHRPPRPGGADEFRSAAASVLWEGSGPCAAGEREGAAAKADRCEEHHRRV